MSTRMAAAGGDYECRSACSNIPTTTMTTLTILNGNGLLGQHLINVITDYEKFASIRVWNADAKQVNRLPANNNAMPVNFQYFVGPKSLGEAIFGSDVVINLREYFDASNCPNDQKIDLINRRFVEKVTACCQDAEVKVLIQLSSIYVQCTPMWPNVYQREAAVAETGTIPFQSYVRSKGHAENRVFLAGDDLRVVIVRVGPLYGEGDICSPVCDALKVGANLGYIPVYGDRGGVMQMTYAGNVAHSIVQMAAEMMENEKKVHQEVVTICDDTPLKDIYTTVLEPLACRRDLPLGSSSIPFYVLFPVFVIIAWMARLFYFFGLRTPFANAPDPVYIYFMFRHWTCFSDFRMRIFFDLEPKYTYKESIERCRSYYQTLNVDKIHHFSWKNNSY